MMFCRRSFLLLVFEVFSAVAVDFKFGQCRFKYGDDQKIKDTNNKIQGYFWRDYDGLIPEDAYTISNPTQIPRHFIGLAYDPTSQDLYATTIEEGMKTVYIYVNGTVRKIDQFIKILCTHQPTKMIKYNLTVPGTLKYDDVIFVAGGHFHTSNRYTPLNLGVALIMNNFYAASLLAIRAPSTFVTMNGTAQSTTNYFLMLYLKTEPPETSTQKPNGNPYFNYQYQYLTNPNSVIPSYKNSLKFGGYSLSCSNLEGPSGGSRYLMPITDIAMNYFWIPSPFFSEGLKLQVGQDIDGNKIYIGQGADGYLGICVGETDDGRHNYTPMETYVGTNIFDVLTFGTANPKKFTWTPSSSNEFPKLSKENMKQFLNGGMLPNGTKVFVGRVHDGNRTAPASIRVFGESAYAYFSRGYKPAASLNFDILTFDG